MNPRRVSKNFRTVSSCRALATGTLLLSLSTAFAFDSGDANAASGISANGDVVASVNSNEITQAQYEEAVRMAWRKRFYHGQPPQAQQDALRAEVLESLIDRTLFVAEAERRGLSPDPGKVKPTMDMLQQRYPNDPRLESIQRVLEEGDLVRQLESQVRAVPEPTLIQVRDYFERHPDKFTEPPRQRLSMILLRVDPSSAASVWDAARAEAADLVDRLRAGADFSEMARIHSADLSANNGGDLGYLHKGVLNEAAENSVASLEVGRISDPLRILSGIAIFRVTERLPARKLSFDEARDRAEKLLKREQSETAWNDFRRGLRSSARIEIFDVVHSQTDE